jgi:acyl carrier protein
MHPPVPPVKTLLGQDELRTRSHGLNQRHRTMLFLVDGRRPLSEVLALGLQAGASTTHFEDLVHLGLVELVIDDEQPDATPSQQGALDSGGASTRSGVLAFELDPSSPAAAPTRPSPRLAVAPGESAIAESPATRPTPLPVDPPSALSIAQSRALAKAEADDVLQQVRELLIDTLRVDAPVFSAITLMRVHRARSSKDLIDLVWEIERHLGVSRKRRREMLSLHRARELLGMGNTQVSLDSDETGFPDTE